MKISKLSDYEYIIRIIDYLNSEFNISFFITSKDFDVLYKWWEKNIPFSIVKRSISNVYKRWKRNNKSIYGFSNFSYEVGKNFKISMELNINVETDIELRSIYDEVEEFMKNFPSDLLKLKKRFEEAVEYEKNGSRFDFSKLYDEMILLFENDNELEIRKKIFLKNIMPGLRNPELEKKFEINYLKKRYRIPDFELL